MKQVLKNSDSFVLLVLIGITLLIVGSQLLMGSSQQIETIELQKPLGEKVNINTASLAELEQLEGIGPVLAARIIEYREAHGGFKSIEELKNVKGIGPKIFTKLKDKITVNHD